MLAIVTIAGVLLQIGPVLGRDVRYVCTFTAVSVYNGEVAVAHVLETKLLDLHVVASPLLYVGAIVGLPVFYIQTLIAEYTAKGVVSILALYNPLSIWDI